MAFARQLCHFCGTLTGLVFFRRVNNSKSWKISRISKTDQNRQTSKKNVLNGNFHLRLKLRFSRFPPFIARAASTKTSYYYFFNGTHNNGMKLKSWRFSLWMFNVEKPSYVGVFFLCTFIHDTIDLPPVIIWNWRLELGRGALLNGKFNDDVISRWERAWIHQKLYIQVEYASLTFCNIYPGNIERFKLIFCPRWMARNWPR